VENRRERLEGSLNRARLALLMVGSLAVSSIVITAGLFATVAGLAPTLANAGCAPAPSRMATATPSHAPAASALGTWSAEQVANAATIVAVGRESGVPARGWMVAVATAMQESSLRNSPTALDHDSLGLFQQRPSQGWGTPEQILDPRYASRKFYGRLVEVAGWQTMRLTQAAQAVQRSAFPEAYQKWEAEAERVVARAAGVATVDAVAGGRPGAPCGVLALAAVEVPAGGWVQPVRAVVGSGFREPGRPTHNGVDLIAPRNSPVRAASGGKVTRVVCNSSIGTCDRDGGVSVRGCGWYVDVLHAGGIVTRYCHLVRQPEVRRGQVVTAGAVLGFVGSSGNSSGPHLHFEVHVRSEPVDPVAFLAQRGLKLAS
jgi:hypothetical protein